MLKIETLTDGGQEPDDIASKIIGFIAGAQRSLDCALYDIRLPGEIGDRVAQAFLDAQARGVAVRIVFNLDDVSRVPVPPPPSTKPEILEALAIPTMPIPGEPDLMHHKYVVRDGSAVWTGSMNWTLDSWTHQENLIVIAESAELAASYTRNFDELWTKQRVADTGSWNAPVTTVGTAKVRPWFTPGRGPELSQRIADAIGAATRRIRIASPVLTAGPILGTLAEVCAERRVDVLGVCDWTQLRTVFGQWQKNPASAWKMPLLAEVLDGANFNGKRSTPYEPDSLHDFMHAKVTVCDDTVFAGSFNLSRSGERNAENVLEITDRALADQMAGFIESIRDLYEDVVPPEFATRPQRRP
ncbi:MAG TPA: phosphatidylserine/phosphatidylglycerophosphate/cardiolipin synthase family protein [Baekduia sp.]|nr:phosphatidylserine/phosphatidylglycerophosphate/cardiolipin synthase family protein [Baekduia sp.]